MPWGVEQIRSIHKNAPFVKYVIIFSLDRINFLSSLILETMSEKSVHLNFLSDFFRYYQNFRLHMKSIERCTEKSKIFIFNSRSLGRV